MNQKWLITCIGSEETSSVRLGLEQERQEGHDKSQLSDHLGYLIIRNFRWKSPGGLLPPVSPQQFRQLVHVGFGRMSDQLAGPHTDATPAADGSLFRYDFYLNSAVGNILQGNCEMDPFFPCLLL